MRIIEIAPLSNGAHRNQSYPGFVPDGWAIIKEGVELSNFPFGNFETEEVDGDIYLKEDTWTPVELPEPTPVPTQPLSQLDLIEAQVTYTAMMTDTLLEV